MCRLLRTPSSERPCWRRYGELPLRPAVFVDRDGTIVRDTHYTNDPERIELIEGAPSAIARLRAAGFAVVVVTNQSGIARGLITGDEYDAVRARVEALMAAAGATIDATYMCPHHPDVTGPCDCRKPGSALFKRAAADLGIDLSRSVLIGDRWRDIEPAAPDTALMTELIDASRRATSFRDAIRAALESVRAALGAQSAIILESDGAGPYRSTVCAPESGTASFEIPRDGLLSNRLRTYAAPLPVSAEDLDAWQRWAAEYRPEKVAEIETLRRQRSERDGVGQRKQARDVPSERQPFSSARAGG